MFWTDRGPERVLGLQVVPCLFFVIYLLPTLPCAKVFAAWRNGAPAKGE
jgi:hypothetical protein